MTFSSHYFRCKLTKSTLCLHYISGVNQWLLLVLLREGCNRCPRAAKLLQSNGSSQTSLQHAHRVHTGQSKPPPPSDIHLNSALLCLKPGIQISSERGFIQGPCVGNQQSLAHSRLWDAVVGFLHVFAHMQMKLSKVNDMNMLLFTFLST